MGSLVQVARRFGVAADGDGDDHDVRGVRGVRGAHDGRWCERARSKSRWWWWW